MKNLIIAGIAALALSTSAQAMDIKINNHTGHVITDFSVDESHHDLSIDPHSSEFTGAYTSRCGAHELEAWGTGGSHWHRFTSMCGDGVFTWDLLD